MANVNLLNQLAGSVAPTGEQFNPAQVMATGQQLQANNAKMMALQEKIAMQRDEQFRRAKAQEILQRASQSDYGAAGREILPLDPDLGMNLMELQAGEDERMAEDQRRAQTMAAIEAYAAQNGLDPAILAADPEGAIGTIQGNLLGGGSVSEWGLSPKYVRMEDGSIGLLQLGKNGEVRIVPMPEGAGELLPGMDMLNLGTQYVPVNSLTGQQGANPLPINLAGAESEKVRGRTTAEREAGMPMDVNAFRQSEQKLGNVKSAIDNALDSIDWTTTGLIGSGAKEIPGTDAYDLAKTIDTIKANLGFMELQAMREASKTGGALGQVTVREIDFLQSTIRSLDQAQSPEQLRANLITIKDQLERVQYLRQQLFQDQYGQSPSGNMLAPATNDAGNDPSFTNGLSPDEQAEYEALQRELGIQ